MTAFAASADVWSVDAGEVNPQRYFGATVANGAIGIVSSHVPLHTQETLVAGAYEPLALGEVSSIPRSFDLLNVELEINGTRVDQPGAVRHFHQRLDLRQARLVSSFDTDAATVQYSMRALRQLPQVAMLEISVRARKPVSFVATTALGNPTGLADVQHFDMVLPPGDEHDRTISLTAASARGPSGRLTIAAAQGFLFSEASGAPQLSAKESRLTFSRSVAVDSTYTFIVLAATMTSAQAEDPLNAAKRMAMFAGVQGGAHLIAEHERAWADLWQSGITIDGDAASQRDVNAMLYHLYSFAREGSHRSVPPMGLSSLGYNGHIFWDAELWMFPVYLALQPRIAESMLDYRYERLAAARRNAAAFGYRGAMFPWESATTGEDDTPLPAMSGVLEQHVTADVAVAAWNYYRVMQDKIWLRDKGYPLIRATADFWASRVTRNGPGHYDIDNVMGADEFAAPVNNDAFTNAAARTNLGAAIEASKVLGVDPDPDWEQVRDNIPILQFPDGLTREHATYHGEAIKQADVNLLAYPLNVVTEPRAIHRDLAYYENRVSASGPAMTHSIFSILYARLGDPERAYAMFDASFRSRQCPPFGAIAESVRSDNPYFATGAGGTLQSLLFGFGGLEITDHGLVQRDARLPRRWKALTLTGVGPQKQTYSVRGFP